LAEVNRIATQTAFNGRKVLDGSFGNATFQVGANVGETIQVGLDSSVKQADIGNIFASVGTGVNVNTVIAATADTTAVASASGTSGAFTDATLTGGTDTFTLGVGGVNIVVTA